MLVCFSRLSHVNRPFYRYGGHFEFINLKYIIGFPGGENTRNVFVTGYVTLVYSAAYSVN